MEQFVARVHLRQLILVSGLEVHRKQLDIGPANAFPSPPSPSKYVPQIQLGSQEEHCEIPWRGLRRSPSGNQSKLVHFSSKI